MQLYTCQPTSFLCHTMHHISDYVALLHRYHRKKRKKDHALAAVKQQITKIILVITLKQHLQLVQHRLGSYDSSKAQETGKHVPSGYYFLGLSNRHLSDLASTAVRIHTCDPLNWNPWTESREAFSKDPQQCSRALQAG